jgi:hypothetical protein
MICSSSVATSCDILKDTYGWQKTIAEVSDGLCDAEEVDYRSQNT